MISYFLNNLEAAITKDDIKTKFKTFGEIESVYGIKDDRRHEGRKSTIINFKTLDIDNFKKYCVENDIIAIEKHNGPRQRPRQEISIVNTVPGPSFYFYKDSKFGNEIENNFRLTDNSYKDVFEVDGLEEYQIFELTTTYPGLLVGSGYNHPVIKSDDNYQLGFSFDHTTGMPIISGSSIKGVLRSVFDNTELLMEMYDYEKKDNVNPFSDDKTVFYDAYIVKTHEDNKGKIFASDFITTHHPEDEKGQFKDPTPIKFLKILSEVTFKFQIKADRNLVELFKKIILDFGLGAKTNVGYGQFRD